MCFLFFVQQNYNNVFSDFCHIKSEILFKLFFVIQNFLVNSFIVIVLLNIVMYHECVRKFVLKTTSYLSISYYTVYVHL